MTTRAKTRARTGRVENRQSGFGPAAGETVSLHDFEQLAGEEGIQIEHLTIPGYLRRIPYRWHMDEVTKFGDKVGRSAEAMQLSYITAIDRSLGVIRVFPRPLLERIYALMAPHFGWPGVVEVNQIEDGKRASRDSLRKIETLTGQLNELVSATDEPKVVEAAGVLVQSLEAQAGALREELAIPADG